MLYRWSHTFGGWNIRVVRWVQFEAEPHFRMGSAILRLNRSLDKAPSIGKHGHSFPTCSASKRGRNVNRALHSHVAQSDVLNWRDIWECVVYTIDHQTSPLGPAHYKPATTTTWNMYDNWYKIKTFNWFWRRSLACWLGTCWNIHWNVYLLVKQVHIVVAISTTSGDRTLL